MCGFGMGRSNLICQCAILSQMTQMSQMENRDPRTYAIIGAAMEVHTELGPGFLEAVYHQALVRELKARGIPAVSELPLVVRYKGDPLDTTYKADLVCFGEVVVELKAHKRTHDVDKLQVIHYLKATRLSVGLLLNFGTEQLDYQRFVFTHPPETASASSVASATKGETPPHRPVQPC